MIRFIYIEHDVAEHPRTLEIQGRFPEARRIYCERYTEIFNRKAQNFRLQKKQPALILAGKYRQRLLPVPGGYGLGTPHAYYFSHMLNCLYDCRYCFLQGMFRSAHYVLFVNYEDFARDIEQVIRSHGSGPVQFFSGYDCDSLALDPLTRFTEFYVPLFAGHPQALLELRTKSTQIRKLLARRPVSNCVVAFSFTPQPVAVALEHKTPSIARRIEAMVRLQQQGWQIGLRFDPVIFETNYRNNYARLFNDIFCAIDRDALHSVTLGSMRLPAAYFNNMVRLYPDEPLFAPPLPILEGPLTGRNGTSAGCRGNDSTMLDYCHNLLSNFVPREKIYRCD